MNKSVILSKSPEETEEIAREISEKVKSGGIIALFGELGSGKTTFTKGLSKALGIKERVISPTFVLVREHRIKNYESRIRKFYHIDLYRVKKESELTGLGIKEILLDKENIIAIEWAEKAKGVLPKGRIEVYFEYKSENERFLTIHE